MNSVYSMKHHYKIKNLICSVYQVTNLVTNDYSKIKEKKNL